MLDYLLLTITYFKLDFNWTLMGKGTALVAYLAFDRAVFMAHNWCTPIHFVCLRLSGDCSLFW